jgi:hypothetical protein
MPRKSISVTNPTQCINKATLCSRNNDVGHISDEVLDSLAREILLN